MNDFLHRRFFTLRCAISDAVIREVNVRTVETEEEPCEGCKKPARVCTVCGVWLCPECYDSIGEGEEEDEEEA